MSSQESKQAFLTAYSDHGSIGKACKITGVSRSLVILWREEDSGFRDAMDEIYEILADEIEQGLMALAGDPQTPEHIRKGVMDLYLTANRKNNKRYNGDTEQ
jgi:hypothetical protein